jgi:hypothetical protein
LTASTRHLSPAQADRWITPARLAPFLEVVCADRHLAADLYVRHARLSSACMEVIHHVEVLVRNTIHRQLRHDERKDGLRSWLIDPAVLKPGELPAVEDAVSRIRRLGRPVTCARVVAGLPLSFWTRLVGIRYDELWKSSLHHAFPRGSGTRRDVAGQLNRISQLRNDIAHHQPIIGIPVEDRHQDMLDLAAAIDPAAGTWIAALSRVEETLAACPADPTAV